MKKPILIFCFIISLLNAFSQTEGIDSTLKKLAAEKNDNVRIDIIYSSTAKVGESNPLLGLQYAQRLLEYAVNTKDKIAQAYMMSYMGKMYAVSGNTEKGLTYAFKGKEIAEQTGNEKIIGTFKFHPWSYL